MAIDLCSETSPRISFSHDLGQTDVVPLAHHIKSRLDSSLLDSNYDFEFGIHEHESSSADELFSGGVILPIQIRERTATPTRVQYDCQTQPLLSLPPRPGPSGNYLKKEILKKMEVANSESEDQKPQSKSFWSFKRSTSLNGDHNGSKKSLLCSIPLLSRSNSTGSVPNPKRATMSSSSSKDNNMKQNSRRLSSTPMAKSASSTTTASTFYTYQMQQKGQLKKSYGSSYGHGGRISPVLNVPPPYISKSTASLFGLGSFFSNGKDKKNRT